MIRISELAPLPTDFLVVTATSTEGVAVQEALKHFGKFTPTTSRLTGLKYLTNAPDDSSKTPRIVHVKFETQTRVPAGVFTAYALRDWRPACVIVAGIARWVNPDSTRRPEIVRAGHLVIPPSVIDYSWQKYRNPRTPHRRGDTEFKERVFSEPLLLSDQDLSAIKDRLRPRLPTIVSKAAKGLRGLSPKLEVRVFTDRPLLTGDWKVDNDHLLDALVKKYNAGALEMEAGGVAAACAAIRSTPKLLVIKAISDPPPKKGLPGEPYRGFACRLAASCVREVIHDRNLLPRLADDQVPACARRPTITIADRVRHLFAAHRPFLTYCSFEQYAELAAELSKDARGLVAWFHPGSPLDVPSDSYDRTHLTSWDRDFRRLRLSNRRKLRIVVFPSDRARKKYERTTSPRRTRFEESCGDGFRWTTVDELLGILRVRSLPLLELGFIMQSDACSHPLLFLSEGVPRNASGLRTLGVFSKDSLSRLPQGLMFRVSRMRALERILGDVRDHALRGASATWLHKRDELA